MHSYSACLLWQGDKKGFLWPPDWHQRPCRQRQAIRAPGPRLSLQYDKAKDGCQKNRTFHLVIEVHERFVCGYMCMNLSFACIWCNHTCTCLCLCVSVHVCQADQMLRSSLQGALISCVFTVTDGQQSAARPAAGQTGMNGTAYKGQHPQGSQLTHQPDHYNTSTHTPKHLSDLFLPIW